MHIKKLANTAENAFAGRSMILGENEELFRQNCEKEVGASTRAKKAGNAPVMKAPGDSQKNKSCVRRRSSKRKQLQVVR
jgi:hypothetical protein